MGRIELSVEFRVDAAGDADIGPATFIAIEVPPVDADNQERSGFYRLVGEGEQDGSALLYCAEGNLTSPAEAREVFLRMCDDMRATPEEQLVVRRNQVDALRRPASPLGWGR